MLCMYHFIKVNAVRLVGARPESATGSRRLSAAANKLSRSLFGRRGRVAWEATDKEVLFLWRQDGATMGYEDLEAAFHAANWENIEDRLLRDHMIPEEVVHDACWSSGATARPVGVEVLESALKGAAAV